jgi:two-component sensor histidine kinase
MALGIDDAAMAKVEAAFSADRASDLEIHYRRKDESEFWASLLVSPVCDDHGKVLQQFLSFVDLTKHRRDEARCKMLIDELNHRVKNSLSTVQSIVSQGLRGPGDATEMKRAIEARLFALARSHDLLTSEKWEGAGLHELVATAMQPFATLAGNAERLTIEGKDLRLSPKATLSLAIALHELATNAVKYGSFSNDGGTTSITWTVAPSLEGNRLVLVWQELGGPPVTPPTHKGFGSWVIERGLAHELNGTVVLAYPESGVMCTIDVPILGEAE